MNEDHFKKLERMYLQANVNRIIFDSTSIIVEEGKSEISMNVTDKFHHKGGAMHGTVYFKLLDDSAYFAANSIETEFFLLTSSFNINLLRPVVEGEIKAIGTIRSKTKNLFVAESTLYDARGREVAFGTGNFMKSRVQLTDKIGYE
ncbi:MAG: PaaI family thioesterase [Flavobacteriales bacterium]